MQVDPQGIENGVRFVAGAYGLGLPFANGELRQELKSLGAGVESVSFDILQSSFCEPLISYTFVLGQFTGFVPLVVPVREQMAHHELTWRLSAQRDGRYEAPNPEGWKRAGTKSGKPFIRISGMLIWAREDLRSRGVILSYDPESGEGFIQSGARLTFSGAWMRQGVPETGMEVEFLPVARVMRGLEAREIKPCHKT